MNIRKLLSVSAVDVNTFLLRKIRGLTYHRLPKQLSKDYLTKAEIVIKGLIERVNKGEKLDSVLTGFNGYEFTERVVEYTYFAQWLNENIVKSENLLDVGCTLNNPIVTETLMEKINDVWLCNVAIEPTLCIRNPVYYHISSLENAFSSGFKFKMITSLSTLEHIGYDNSQYGRSIPAVFNEVNDDVLVRSMMKLVDLLDENGKMLISVPYGFREVVVHPKTLRIFSQVFDFSSLEKVMRNLNKINILTNLTVYEVKENGWLKVDPQKCNVKYADKGPAASAVALLEAKK